MRLSPLLALPALLLGSSVNAIETTSVASPAPTTTAPSAPQGTVEDGQPAAAAVNATVHQAPSEGTPPEETPAAQQPVQQVSAPPATPEPTTSSEPSNEAKSAASTSKTEASPIHVAVLRPIRRGPTSGPQLEGPRDGVADCRTNAAVCWRSDAFALWPRLRLRSGYEFVQADSQLLTVGRNDGFFFDQNRVGFDGAFRDDFRFRLIVDVVSSFPGTAPNDPVQPIGTTVRDAWVAWLPSDWLVVSVGQQFMPSDLEGSTTVAGLPFARRSVATSGVRAGHGFAVQGLSPTRQLGVVVGSTENARSGDLVFEYQLAASNGNGQNQSGNDNKTPAAYARIGAGYVSGDVDVRLGLGGRYNPRTVGTLPNLFVETDAVGFADVSARVVGFVFVAQGIVRQTTFNTLQPAGGPTDNAIGATAWVQLDSPMGFDLLGVKPAYRVSYYDPSSAFPDDQLLENSLGLRWDVPVEGLPLALFVDGTLLTEWGEGVRDLDNARLSTLLQFDF
jgi:hypothetical protein